MLTISNKLGNIAEAVKLRVGIFIFLYLSLQFALFFIMASVSTYPLMAMWGGIFVELTAMIIFNLRYGRTALGRDINTLIFYGVVLHLLYIPFYSYGIDLSAYHNNAQKGLNALIVLRLLLPLQQDLLQRIAVIEYAKAWFHQNQPFVRQYVNGLTVSIFILCALPLFTLMYFINSDQMRITGIAIVLYAFFVAFENSKTEQKPAPQPRPAVQENDNTDVDAKFITLPKEDVELLRNGVKLLAGLLAIAFITALAVSGSNKESTFLSGYAAGYHDGKTGAPPKTTMNLGKMLYCQLVFDRRQPRNYGEGEHECDPKHFDKK